MNAMEKKLSSAIDELIDEVIKSYPNLTKPLAKIQRVLRKTGAPGCGSHVLSHPPARP
jgi:hypothetical protein